MTGRAPDGAAPQHAWSGAAVVVLAGGASRRMGRDKLAERLDRGVGGSAPLRGTVLDAVLSGVPDQVPVVLVGPRRTTPREVTAVREEPPGGGPAAGVAAGVAAVDGAARYVVVLAGDAPFSPRAVPELLAALAADPVADAAVAVDPIGHPQPLLAAYRSQALRSATAGNLWGRPARALLDHLAVVRVPVRGVVNLDVDTPADLALARRTALRVAPPATEPAGAMPQREASRQ